MFGKQARTCIYLVEKGAAHLSFWVWNFAGIIEFRPAVDLDMGHKLKKLCQVEARTFGWLIGMVFSIVLVTQYFELPFGNLITSRSSAGETQLVGIGTFSMVDSSTNNNISSNTTIFSDLISTATDTSLDFDNKTKTTEGKETGPKNNFVPEKNRGSDDSIESDAERDAEDESPSVDFMEDESPSVDFVELNGNSTVDISTPDNNLAPKEARESAYSFTPKNVATESNSSLGSTSEESTAFTEEENAGISAGPATSSLALPPIISFPNLHSPNNEDIDSQSPMSSVYPNTSAVDKDIGSTIPKVEKSEEFQRQTVLPENSSSKNNVSPVKEGSEPAAAVVSISEMNDLLLHSRASSFSTVCACLSFRN